MPAIIPLALGVALVYGAENVHNVAHAALHTRVAVGLVFMAPFVLAAIWLTRRKKAKPRASQSVRRYTSPFSGQR